MNVSSADKPSGGSRSRTGCLACRARKRRCDEQKPICGKCRLAQTSCTYPKPFSNGNIRFVVAQALGHQTLPLEGRGGTDFVNLLSHELPVICPQYNHLIGGGLGDINRTYEDLRLYPPVYSMLGVPGESHLQIEPQLVQYCMYMISQTRSVSFSDVLNHMLSHTLSQITK